MTPPTFAVLGSLAYGIVCLAALVWGGKAERWVAAAMLIELVAAVPLQGKTSTEAPHYAVLLLELVVLASLAYAAFTTERRWTLPATALQIISTVGHVSRMIDPTIHSWTYVTVSIVTGYGVLICLLVGTLTAHHGGGAVR